MEVYGAKEMSGWRFAVQFCFFLSGLFLPFLGQVSAAKGQQGGDLESPTEEKKRPNILFCIADDWGWPHAGAYGDKVVKTPTFDRLAREGILFRNAFVSSPSCTPSRNSILTGQHHWRLGWGANLHSKLDTKHQTYPHLLQDSGYFVGHWRKSWGPGRLDNWLKGPGHPAGKKYPGFAQFLKLRPKGKPFCFWLGASDPHRPYKKGSGKKSGMDLSKVHLFSHFPDSEAVRSDVADYYYEVQRFDSDVAAALKQLEAIGELDNTIVVMTGDHGMPFPRCKANLYDSGTRIPMAVRWPAGIRPGRVVDDLVSTVDLAPTFLSVASVPVPKKMSGRSWVNIFQSTGSGMVDKSRESVLVGKERHVPCQEGDQTGGTPMRGIRTADHLLIWNIRPERWPAGTPNYKKAYIPSCWLGDCDNGPTKSYIVDNQNKDDRHRMAYQRCFGKRPSIELYDVGKDPDQIRNLAELPEHQELIKRLKERLTKALIQSGDPRILENQEEVQVFEKSKYFGFGPRHPSYRKKAEKKKKTARTE